MCLSLANTLTKLGAANRVRTGDIHVGNVMLYQLSYSRINLVSDARIELALLGPKPRVIPFHQSELKIVAVLPVKLL